MLAGARVLVWPGVYGTSRKASIVACVEQLPIIAPALQAFVRMLRFHIATFKGDARMRKRIEAAIAGHLYR